LRVDEGGLVAPHAAKTPAGGHHVGYEVDFDGVGGLKEVVIGVEPPGNVLSSRFGG
jgi:hypothetical protein